MTKEEIALELTKLLIDKGFYGYDMRENETDVDFNKKRAEGAAAMFNVFLDTLKVDQ